MKEEARLVHVWDGTLHKGRRAGVSMAAGLTDERFSTDEPGGEGPEDSGF